MTDYRTAHPVTASVTQKRCGSCNETLPAAEFHRMAASRDNLRGVCKDCARRYRQAYRAAHPEVRSSTVSVAEKPCGKCRKTLPAEAFSRDRTRSDGLQGVCKDCKKQYRQDNSESIAAYSAGYRQANRASAAAHNTVYRQANREAAAAYRAVYYQANREAIAAQQASYRAAHPEGRRAAYQRRRARKAGATIEKFTRAELMQSFDDRGLVGCTYCGGPFEHIDHIVPLSRGGAHSMENLTPSCARCNLRKGTKTGHEFGPQENGPVVEIEQWSAMLCRSLRMQHENGCGGLFGCGAEEQCDTVELIEMATEKLGLHNADFCPWVPVENR